MDVPFSLDEFLDAFTAYNTDIWPLQFVVITLAIAIAVDAARHGRFVNLGLAALWLWSGIAYHWLHFSKVTPAAWVFGSLFLIQALLFFNWKPHPAPEPRKALGLALATYAIAVYPATAYLAGHRYPAQPTFGAPCPVTIFTIGILLMSAPPLSVKIAVIPLLWAAVATSAATQLGIREDFALTVSGALLALIAMWDHRAHAGRSFSSS